MKGLISRIWNSPTLMTWGNMLSTSIKLLLLTPLILVKYNIDEIAFWYLLLTINSFIIVIDFGFYPTFSRVVSFAFHGLKNIENISPATKPEHDKPNWDLMGKIYGTINFTYLVLGLIILLIIFSFTYLPVKEIISRTSEQSNLWTAYIIYSISVFVSFFAKKFDAVIIGTNNIVIINRWDIINNALNAISSVIIVYFGLDLIYLALNQLFFSFVLVIRDYYLERSICDGKFKEFKFFSFHKDVFVWCWNPVWKSGILILCSTGINQASGLIYSNVSDSAKLASYLLSLKLITTIAQFSQAPFYSKLPRFSGLRVQNNIQGLIDTTAQSMKKALFVYAVGITVLLFLGSWGLTFIGSKASLVNPDILIVMGLVWFLERHHAMHAQVYVTTNKIPFYKSAIVSGIVNLSMVIFLLPKIGVWAFPISQGVSNLLINNWWNVYLSVTSLNISFFNYFKRSALYPSVVLLLSSFIRFIIS